MYVWSKKLAIGLLAAFALFMIVFMVTGMSGDPSVLKGHTTRWIALNYAGLLVWVFVWMFDQARLRSKPIWVWLVPFALAPLPTLMVFVLFLQKKLKA